MLNGSPKQKRQLAGVFLFPIIELPNSTPRQIDKRAANERAWLCHASSTVR